LTIPCLSRLCSTIDTEGSAGLWRGKSAGMGKPDDRSVLK
jgi:hypothetical protein